MAGDDDTIATRRRSRNRLGLLPFLHEEIIVEILVRLPVRSLFQYKCVCKTWKTLISDHQFAKCHFLSSTPSLRLVSSLLGLENCELVSYPLKPLLENPSTPVKPAILRSTCQTRIVGSCNGLLCLYNFTRSNFRLWNPSINFQSKTSPTFVCCFYHKFIMYRGFGYDQVNDKYKVLVVVQNKYNSKETKTIIYTFGENNWTTVQNFPCEWDQRRDYHRWLGKFVSGTLNWIVNNKDGVDSNSTNQEVIISFDLEKETYGEVLLPQYDGNNVRHPVLYVSSDCICVCFNNYKEESRDVWMMKEYGVVESWTKLMIIPEKKLICDDIPRFHLLKALLISENGLLLLRTNNSKLFVYNLNNNGQLDYHRILGKFEYDLHIYQESLISLQWLKHSE